VYQFETTLPFEESSVSASRDCVRDVLRSVRLAIPPDVALLLTSELVTNAIQFGQPPVVLSIVVDDGLTISVSDSESSVPVRRPVEPLSQRGRGLLLVGSMADRWGVEDFDGTSKTVWFQMDQAPDRVGLDEAGGGRGLTRSRSGSGSGPESES
jgi:anti-sigma regulatory factor (Ser/Thr protein kinase)